MNKSSKEKKRPAKASLFERIFASQLTKARYVIITCVTASRL